MIENHSRIRPYLESLKSINTQYKKLTMITLEEIIIRRGDLEKIYRSNITLTLWRALNLEDDVNNPLYPDIEPRRLPNGDVRNPDISTYSDNHTKQKFVRSQEGVGTSLVDKTGIFGHKKWEYIMIPAGTVIPNELVITKDHYIPRKKCWHYSISPNYNMPLSTFLDVLDKLATNAGIKLRSPNAQSK